MLTFFKASQDSSIIKQAVKLLLLPHTFFWIYHLIQATLYLISAWPRFISAWPWFICAWPRFHLRLTPIHQRLITIHQRLAIISYALDQSPRLSKHEQMLF